MDAPLLQGTCILSPMPRGSGAIELHRRLSGHFRSYDVRGYSPWSELFPLVLGRFKRVRCDLVHTTADYAIYLRQRSIPLVATLHGYNLDKAFRPHATLAQRIHYATDLRWSMRMGLEIADAVISVSHAAADLARSDLGITRDIQVIPNGVDANRFRPRHTPLASPEIRVLFSGNLSRRKGGHLLPAIADRLTENVKLVCAAGLRARGSAFEHPRIEWLGRVPPHDMPALYQSVDMLLMPSVREGLSLSVLEAMACGLPVVASNASSFPEQIHPEKGGHLCAPGDAAAFANRVNELAESPTRRLEMGQYNRQRVESEYRETAMAKEYARVFESVLDSR